jgi:peptide/nickel transport system substrate-binding protein
MSIEPQQVITEDRVTGAVAAVLSTKRSRNRVIGGIRMKKTLALVLATVMVSVLIAGCSSSGGTLNGTSGKVRDTVTVLGRAVNATFNPFLGAPMETWVSYALFDHLVRFDAKGNIQPMLAESWVQEDDGVTLVFKIRPGVKSHDGKEINADDVIFSFDSLFAKPQFYYLKTYMASWEKVDDLTVRIVKAAPYCETLNMLATQCPIVSKDAYEEIGSEAFAKHPVGTGPYTLVSQGADGSVTLKAFPDYWNGKPEIENLIVKPPMDMSTAVVALQNKELDLITEVPAAQWSIIRADPNLVFETSSGWSAMTLCFMNNLKHDVNLRKAIYHGVNRKNAIVFGTEGTAIECKDVYSALTMKELSGTFDVPGYDVELAKDYLAKSNYVPGTEIRLTVSDAETAAVAQSIQNDMNQIGVTIKIQQVDHNALTAMIMNGELDLFLSSMGMAMVSTIDMLLYWETDNPIWGPQIAHDTEYDDLCDAMRTEVDHANLMKLAHRAIEIQCDLTNHLGIYEKLFSVAHTKEITGVAPIYVAAYVFYPGDLKRAQ